MRLFYFVPIVKNYLLTRNVQLILRRQSSRNLLGDKISTAPQKTLIGRLLLYLDNSVSTQQQNKVQSNAINDIIKGDMRVLQTLNVNEISDLFYNINNTNCSQNKRTVQNTLNAIDVECSLRLNNMDLKTALRVLGGLMHIIPSRITEYKFFKCLTSNVDEYVKNASKQELIQLMFYLGLEKKNTKIQKGVKKCLNRISLEFLDELTVEEICIVCNSTYRTQTKISEANILDKIKLTLQENLFIMNDPAFLITLIKTIRNNHCEDEDLLSTIACTVFFNKTVQYYNFAAMCHILTLFADYLYYEKELLDLFANKCFKELEEYKPKSRTTHVSESIRVKDLTTFLWVMSTLDYTNVDHNVLKNLFIPKIKERIVGGDYEKCPDHLAESILHMWTMGYRAKELLSYVLLRDNVKQIHSSPQTKGRLNLLLSCIKYEDPSFFEKLKIQFTEISNYNLNAQINNRPILRKVFQCLQTTTDVGFDKFGMETQIPHLNIVGISGYKNNTKAVNIEILDEYTCLKNKDNCPSGLMNLKLRILDNLNIPVVTVTQEDIDDMDDEELRNYLKEEIQLFCEK